MSNINNLDPSDNYNLFSNFDTNELALFNTPTSSTSVSTSVRPVTSASTSTSVSVTPVSTSVSVTPVSTSVSVTPVSTSTSTSVTPVTSVSANIDLDTLQNQARYLLEMASKQNTQQEIKSEETTTNIFILPRIKEQAPELLGQYVDKYKPVFLKIKPEAEFYELLQTTDFFQKYKFTIILTSVILGIILIYYYFSKNVNIKI